MAPTDSVLPLALVATLVAVVLVPVTAAAPPPQTVCGVCGENLETAAAREGVSLAVTNSSLTIAVDEDGTGRWRARVGVAAAGGGANATGRPDSGTANASGRSDGGTANTTGRSDGGTRALSDPSVRERIVRRAYERGRTVVDDPGDLDTGFDGGVLTVRFTVPNVGHRSVGGALLVDYFRRPPTEGQYVIEADRVVVRGPEGTVPAGRVTGVPVRDGAVVWMGGADGTSVDAYLVFVSGGGIPGTAAAALAVGLARVTAAGTDALVLGAPAAVVLALAALGMIRFRDRLPAWSLGDRPTDVAGGRGVETAAVASAAAAVVAGLCAVALLAAVTASPVGPGFGSAFAVVFFVAWALGSAVVGLAFFVAGRAVGGASFA
ncbi:MAG: hypothetical protein ABEJ40_10000 [Haloarculaceae archaeon]